MLTRYGDHAKKGELSSVDVHDYSASLVGWGLKIFEVASSCPVQF